MECILRAIFALVYNGQGQSRLALALRSTMGHVCVLIRAHVHSFGILLIYFDKYTRRRRILNIEYYGGEDVHSCLSLVETTGETEYREMSYANRRRSRFREYLMNVFDISLSR